MSDNWWSNNWSNVAISVATALTFFVGWLQFVASKKAAAQLNRANVFFSIQVDGEKVVLSLRNVGRSIARNVKVAIDPPMKVNYFMMGAPSPSIKESWITQFGCPTLLPDQDVKDEKTFSANEIKNGFTNWYKFRTTVWFYDDYQKTELNNTVEFDLARYL